MAKRILCAIDDTDHAKSGVIEAAELCALSGAPLTICTVNVLQGGLRGPAIYLHDDKDVERILADAEALASNHGAKQISKVVLSSRDIATAIIQYAEQNGFDHIVAGAGHHRGLSRLVIGSVAADIVARAHCSVTIATRP
jgi:nucleotide-binding universal stress UspA family protein